MKIIKCFKINNYPYNVVVSNKVRPIYYKETDKIPIYIQHRIIKGLYSWKKKGSQRLLYDNLSNKFLIKNEESANKPKLKKINGQQLHTLQLKDYERSNIINTIKDYVIPILQKQSKGEQVLYYPISIQFVYITPRDILDDLDNHKLFYEKVILDCLQPYRVNVSKETTDRVYTQAVNYIDNDSVDCVISLNHKWFESDNDSNDMYLIIEEYEKFEIEEQKYYYQNLFKKHGDK